MAKEYKIEIKINDEVFKESINLNYNDETWRQCEELLRDSVTRMVSRYIDKEFYP